MTDGGLTGEVLARHLFNELLKRRRTITRFETGQLTSLSSERYSDMVTADGRFSLQSVFRALRALTGSETASTPQDLSQLSQRIQRMQDSTPSSPDAALARAHHAYGEALMRQGDKPAALLAWTQARSFDPNYWWPYWSAATALCKVGALLLASPGSDGATLARLLVAPLGTLGTLGTMRSAASRPAAQATDSTRVPGR